MAQKLMTFLPELVLLFSLPVMWFIRRFRLSATPKTYCTIARYFLVASLALTVVLYNYSGLPHFYENSLYTSLFKVIILSLSFVWFSLSCKWFLVEDRSSISFYALAMVSLVSISLMISGLNLALMLIAWLVMNLAHVAMFKFSPEVADTSKNDNYYLGCILFFGLLLTIACCIFWANYQSLDYGTIEILMQKQKHIPLSSYVAGGLIVAVFLFSMMLVPFHLWYVDLVKSAILPISGWITIIPVFAYFACLVDVVLNLVSPVYPVFQPALSLFALLSVVIGAAGVNGENNLHRLFAFSTVFHMGFILICLISFSANSVFSSFVYLFVYSLSMIGVYTVFLGLRSQGSYLQNLEDLSGLSRFKPYISAALMLFMVSLIGTPPMLGFLGKLSVVNNLIIEQQYILLAIVLSSLILIANGYLRVVKYIYFKSPVLSFDRADKGIYFFLFINLLIVIISLFHPKLIMSDFEKMLITVF